MRRRRWRDWLMAALGGVLALGCEKAAVKPSYPPDPVLLSKRPVAGKPAAAPATVIVKEEPVTPVLPESALVHAPGTLSSVARTTAAKPLGPVPGTTYPELPPPPSQPPVPAIPTGQVKTPAAAVPAPPPRRPVAGTYGRAEDFTWLQGVIDHHYQGHVDLRYCDPATEDEWGGKVCLGDDPRLRQFKDGDVVLVEGELAIQNAEPQHHGPNHYPLYRVRNIELIRSQP
jgi:hypothetical protein